MNSHSSKDKVIPAEVATDTTVITSKASQIKSRPSPPEPPEEYECCNSGCEELCVFEIYKVQKAEYEAVWGNQSSSQ